MLGPVFKARFIFSVLCMFVVQLCFTCVFAHPNIRAGYVMGPALLSLQVSILN